MASVIRIKRRRTEDPAEALLLSQKKSRTTEEPDNPSVESVLEFAGTLDSKDDSISKHIKEAIRRKKIHKQMHPHSSGFKLPHDRGDMTDRIRKQKAESSHNKRYRITCSRRALDIDNLDHRKECGNDEIQGKSVLQCNEDKLQSGQLSDENRKDNSKSLTESSDASDRLHSQNTSVSKNKSSADTEDDKVKSSSALCDGICGSDSKKKEDERVYCLIDVEHEKQPGGAAQGTDTASEITVNGIPMKSVKSATHKVPVMEESDDYVYDLYYTHTRLGHIQDEAVLTVEALCNEFLHDERADEGDDFVYDDEDDSNDESNWRNDYPDEDPHFFENAERDYDFENNMRESNFNGDNDDEGDLLSYWMDTRCNIDVDCNDFEDDNYERDGSSSDEEAGAEMGYY